MQINGNTRLFAILADPIDQVKTPQAINALLQARGLNGIMVPMHVAASSLQRSLEALRHVQNLGGFIVTVPHKQAVASLCDEVSAAARTVGAVNVVRRETDGRLVGDILDGEGFVAGLRAHGIEPAGMRVFLAGAGGAANAIAFALAQSGVAQLGIHNRTAAKVADMRGRLQAAYPATAVVPVGPEPQGFDLVVNATSLGMAATDPLPLDADSLRSSQVVAEIIMQPAVTPLIAIAQARGCRVHLGAPMLECQVDLMARFMGIPDARHDTV